MIIKFKKLKLNLYILLRNCKLLFTYYSAHLAFDIFFVKINAI